VVVYLIVADPVVLLYLVVIVPVVSRDRHCGYPHQGKKRGEEKRRKEERKRRRKRISRVSLPIQCY
jgi:hypothetical protein